MRRIYLLLLLLLPGLEDAGAGAARVQSGGLIFDGIADLEPAMADKLDGFLSARQATPLGWSPQGQLLIATRFGDTDQLHLVERAGGERRQLSFLREPVTQAAFCPDPARRAYVFLKDAGGNENAQLYYQQLGDPAARLLTDGKSMNGGAVWSNSGHAVAFFSTAREGVSFDIDVVEPQSGALPHLAVTGDGAAWYPLDWSPDDRKLLVLKRVSVAEAYLYVVDLGTGQRREVEPAPAKVGIVAARFSRDGQGVYLISDRDSEFAKLRYVNLSSGAKSVLSEHIPWDIEELALSRDGHYLAYVSNEAGVGKLNLLDLRTHQDLSPPKLAAPGVIAALAFDAEGKRLAFAFAPADRPRDAYVLDLAGGQVEAWTKSEAGTIDLSKSVIPRLSQYPTIDRQDGRSRQVPVFLYEPASPGPHPVLIVFHAGAASQFRPSFDPWLQYVVNELKFAVVAPNVRGSSGYGKSYRALADGTLREYAVKDIGALLVWLNLQSRFDAKRVLVSGESHGGYLALAALANYSDRLRGGVDMAGIPNFIQADRIARPLLVVHGKNDPRVAIEDAEQLVNRLRSRGAEVWYLQAHAEGHEFRKQPSRIAYYRSFAQFLRTQR